MNTEKTVGEKYGQVKLGHGDVETRFEQAVFP